MSENNGQCMVPECGKGAQRRGLCYNHYQIAHRLVSKKRTTWDELVAKGKCLEAYRTEESMWFLGTKP